MKTVNKKTEIGDFNIAFANFEDTPNPTRLECCIDFKSIVDKEAFKRWLKKV